MEAEAMDIHIPNLKRNVQTGEYGLHAIQQLGLHSASVAAHIQVFQPSMLETFDHAECTLSIVACQI